MLTQIESFNGVFIASTNLMSNLDEAALRRFDLKVKFDFLLPEQAWGLLQNHCVGLDLDSPMEDLRRRVDRIEMLTPGDFAAVVRQGRFRPIESAVGFVLALEAECSVKQGEKKTIGFLS